MNPDHLIELADQILLIGTGYPRQTINRAISTAYYALFHALAGECVARTVGSPRSSRYWEIVTPVHRSIDHGAARKVFERLMKDRAARSDMKQLAEYFLSCSRRVTLRTMILAAGIRAGRRSTSSCRPGSRSIRSGPCRKKIA